MNKSRLDNFIRFNCLKRSINRSTANKKFKMKKQRRSMEVSYSIRSHLTSMRSVAPGGITSDAPRSPYANDGGMINFLSSPSQILLSKENQRKDVRLSKREIFNELEKTLFPSLNGLSGAYLEDERLTTVVRRIELDAVRFENALKEEKEFSSSNRRSQSMKPCIACRACHRFSIVVDSCRPSSRCAPAISLVCNNRLGRVAR